MFEYMLKALEKYGGKDKDSGKDWSKIINKNYDLEITTPFRVPREESIHVANEINKYVQGLQSKTRTMENLGIESPEDELIMQAYERFNPILNPGVLQEMAEAAQTPQEGAMEGGRIRSEQANVAAQAGMPESEARRVSRGSVKANI